MAEGIRHNCGFCVAHTLHDVYRFIRSLQHRGREAAGIAAVGNERIDVIKWAGPVDRFDVTDLHKIFPSPQYHTRTWRTCATPRAAARTGFWRKRIRT